jgi:hypothetical protein
LQNLTHKSYSQLLNQKIVAILILINLCLPCYPLQAAHESQTNHHALSEQKNNPLLPAFIGKIKERLRTHDTTVLEIGAGDSTSTVLFDLLQAIEDDSDIKNTLTIYINDMEFEHLKSIVERFISEKGKDSISTDSCGFITCANGRVQFTTLLADIKAFLEVEESRYDFIYAANVTHFFNPTEFINFFECISKKLSHIGVVCLAQRDIEDLDRDRSRAFFKTYKTSLQGGDLWAGYSSTNIAPILVRAICERGQQIQDPKNEQEFMIKKSAEELSKTTMGFTYNDISTEFAKIFFLTSGLTVLEIQQFILVSGTAKAIRLACLVEKSDHEINPEHKATLKKQAKEKVDSYNQLYSEISSLPNSELIELLRRVLPR